MNRTTRMKRKYKLRLMQRRRAVINSVGRLFVYFMIAAVLLLPNSITAAADGRWGKPGDPMLTEVSTHAGLGEFGEINGDALQSSFRTPHSLLYLDDGSLLVTDSQSHLIRMVHEQKVSTFAGLTVLKDDFGYPVGGWLDVKRETSFFRSPAGLASDKLGNVYIADAENHVIRKVDPEGQVSTLAGSGVLGHKDGKAGEAQFYYPQDVAVAEDGTVYVADTLNHAIRKISPDGVVTTLNALPNRVVFMGNELYMPAGDYKNGKLKDALFNEPTALALDGKGYLYVSDTGNQRIRYIDFGEGFVTTVAGGSVADDGKSVYEPNSLYAVAGHKDGAAAEALFNYPRGIALADNGGLFVADSLNHTVRYIIAGKVYSLVGDSERADGEIDGIDRYARLHHPTDVIVQATGSLLVADAYNNKIRRIAFYSLPKPEASAEDAVKVAFGSAAITFKSKPTIVSGRTMVPVRDIAEAFGYRLHLVGDGKTVRMQKSEITFDIELGSKSFNKHVDGADMKLESDVAPYIHHSRMYVSVRAIAEAMGLDVQWNQKQRAAIVRKKTSIK
jgi:hypothetical protein